MAGKNNSGIFYGWFIVAIAFIANFLSVGTSFYAFNAFMEPLCDLRGWTRTDVNLALSIGMAFMLLGQIIFGTLVMRLGARKLMIFGSTVAGISFILLFRAQDLIHFYVLSACLTFGNGAYGGIVAGTAVNNWFVKSRGRAIGVASAGISLSGAILPFVAMLLILKSGMVNASFWIGMVILFFGPVAWLVIRDWPEDHGMAPDGADLGDDLEISMRDTAFDLKKERTGLKGKLGFSGSGETSIWKLSKLIKTGAFWKIGFAFPLVLAGVSSVMSQLKPRFSDIGFDDMTAMKMMACTAFIGAIGKYVWGMLCDRFSSKKVVVILFGANCIGLSLGLIHESMAAIIIFIILFGFAMGGLMSTFPIIIADFFGRISFPAVARFISVFFVLELAGFIIAGQSFDRTGSYDMAYILFIILDIIAFFLILTLKRPIIDSQ
jgi:OFA family oxalate/formate antiporter-like MFS transporter